MVTKIYKMKNNRYEVGVVTWRGYPYGEFTGNFSSEQEARDWLSNNNFEATGIPLCTALKDWRSSHSIVEA